MSEMRIGVVSDTHGLLRTEVVEALQGADHILHAGDVGDIEILRRLEEIAPVTAIRGNVDVWGECAELPRTEMIELGGALIYMVHSIADLDIVPTAAGVKAVVSGHSHRAETAHRGGVLYLNPGSIGPRRFQLPVTFAWLKVDGDAVEAEVVYLAV